MRVTFDAGIRWYLWVLMSGLLGQGLGSLLFRLWPAIAAHAPYLIGGVLGIDGWHALIHITWGSIGMAILAVRPRPEAIWLALVFGVFYSVLGVAGVLIHHPFGLILNGFENGFHLTAGPLTLLLGALAARRSPPTIALTA